MLEMVEAAEVIVTISTPVGTLELMGTLETIDRVLHVDRAHIQGLTAGALGRAGLNAIAQKVLQVADVERLVVEGSTRTTGRNPCRRPWTFRFPHPLASRG